MNNPFGYQVIFFFSKWKKNLCIFKGYYSGGVLYNLTKMRQNEEFISMASAEGMERLAQKLWSL
jgi:hypothetical protein